MAGTPSSDVKQRDGVASPANATVATDAHQMPDCIIASSNRFDDLRPFCDKCYATDPQKWGDILPWEFPQAASREVEENFIRNWFDEIDIHMHGGAHNHGAGYRFLKQAWYSIALYNWEHRVPCIADMWMTENKDLVEDPTMFEFLCSLDVQVNTFFNTSDTEIYGEKLLGFAVRKIQETIRQSQEPAAAEQAHSDNSQAVFTALDLILPGEVKSEPTLALKPLPGLVDTLNRSQTMDLASPEASLAASTEQTVPFPAYNESTTRLRGSSRDFTPSYDSHQYDNPYGRKRGMSNGKRFGSGSGLRYPGRQQFNHHDNSRPMQWETQGRQGARSQAYGSIEDTPFAASPTYQQQQGLAFHQRSHNMDPAAGQFVPPGFPNVSSYAGSQYNGLSQDVMRTGYRGGSGQYSARNFSNESAVIGFDDLTNRRGGNRRDSQGSRGAGVIRGNGRHHRGRGGRDSSSFSDHPGSFQERSARNDSGNKFGKRRTSNAQEHAWHRVDQRSQFENQVPERHFSGPGRDMPADGNFGPASMTPMNGNHRLMPPYAIGVYGVPSPSVSSHTFSEHQATSIRQGHKDDMVHKHYVGADATEIRSLIVFNIPSHLSDSDIASAIRHTFGVVILGLRRTKGPHGYGLSLPYVGAIVDFPSHHNVRHILNTINNRGADLFGEPARIEVMRQWWDPEHPKHGDHHASDGKRISHNDMNMYSGPPSGQTWQEYGADRLPHRKLFDPNGPAPAPVHRGAAAGTSFTTSSALTYSLNAPPSIKHDPTLSTVPSAETTPTATSTNTPKKSSKKKNKKDKTNLDNAVSRSISSLTEAHPSSSIAGNGRSSARADPAPFLGAKKASACNEAITSHHQSSHGKLEADTMYENATGFDSKRPSEAHAEHKVVSSLDNAEANATAHSSDRPSKRSEIKTESEAVDDSFHTAKGSPSNASQPDDKGSSERQDTDNTAKTPPQQERTESVSPKTNDHPVAKQSDKTSANDAEAQTATASKETVASGSMSEDKSAGTRKSDKLKRKGKDAAGEPNNTSTDSHAVATGAKPHATASEGKENKAPSLTAPVPVSESATSRASARRSTLSTPTLPPNLDETGTRHNAQASGPAENFGKPDISLVGSSSIAQADADAVKATEQFVVPGGETNAASAFADTKKVSTSQDAPVHHQTFVEESAETLGEVPSADEKPSKTTVSLDGNNVINNNGQAKAETQHKSGAQSKKKLEKQKGPDQTESLSVFSKKQNKKPKKPKGGSLRGPRPQRDVTGSLDSDSTRVTSGASTPAVHAEDQRSRSKSATRNRNKGAKGGKLWPTPKENAVPKIDTTASVVSPALQSSDASSPSKGLFNNLFGMILGTGKPASVASSPDTQLVKPNAENELTKLKEAVPSDALVAHARTTGAVGNVLTADHVAKSKGSVVGDDLTACVDPDEATNIPKTSRSTGLGISVFDDTPLSDTSTEHTPPRKKKSRKGKQKQTDDDCSQEAEGALHPIPTLSLDDTNSEEADPDDESMSSSHTIGRPSPPASSESKLTPSKRKLLDMRGEPDHILKAPAPLNHHAKRKPNSKTPSESASQSSGEATPSTALERYRANAKDKRRNAVLSNIFKVNDGDTLLERAADGHEGGIADEGGRQTLYFLQLANHTSEDVSEQSGVQLVGNVLNLLGHADGENRVVEMEDTDSPEPEAVGSGEQSPVSETDSDESAPAT